MQDDTLKVPDFLRNSVMYQVFLRAFTPGGTLRSAADMIPHLHRLGVDILYISPITEADDDMRQEFWSVRQRKSGLGNPQSPYRVKDYWKIDPEYGTEEDLKYFVNEAHCLGMKVLLDVVYYHCGPCAKLITEHPDFVTRDENGNVKSGEWCFPALNFENPELREYLHKNLEYFVREFDVDGYRCDVSDMVPIDFWETGRRRLEKIKPDIIMLAEGSAKVNQNRAFDFNYTFSWRQLYDVVSGESATRMPVLWQEYYDKLLPDTLVARYTEHHDLANDRGPNRPERVLGPDAHNAMLFINLCLDGIPFIYNGQEIADTAMHSIWANRDHGANMIIDWSRAMTETGRKRFALLQRLIALRHTNPALTQGKVNWLKHDQEDHVLIFTRTIENGQRLLIAANCHDIPVQVNLSGEFATINNPLFEHNTASEWKNGTLHLCLQPFGFTLLEY